MSELTTAEKLDRLFGLQAERQQMVADKEAEITEKDMSKDLDVEIARLDFGIKAEVIKAQQSIEGRHLVANYRKGAALIDHTQPVTITIKK